MRGAGGVRKAGETGTTGMTSAENDEQSDKSNEQQHRVHSHAKWSSRRPSEYTNTIKYQWRARQLHAERHEVVRDVLGVARAHNRVHGALVHRPPESDGGDGGVVAR